MSDPAPSSRTEHRPAAGVALNSFSYFLISAGDALSKIMVAVLPVGQLLGIRAAFAVLFLVPVFLLAWRQGRSVFQTRRLGLHVLRAAVMLVSTFTFFVALRHIDLATITVIMFLMPIFVALFSGPLAGERVGAAQWTAIGVGFAGTLVVLRPGLDGVSFVEALALFSAMLWAVGLLLLRRLATTEPPVTVLALFHVFVLPAFLLLAAWEWQPFEPKYAFVVAGMAGLNLAGQWLGTHAFRFARAATVAPVQYTQIVWASLFSWAIWQQVPSWSVLAGALMIVVAGLILVFAERPKQR